MGASKRRLATCRSRRCAAAIAAMMWAVPSARAAGVPQGFVDESVVSGFTFPVGATFSADGRLFVWEQSGRVWVVEGGDTSLLIDISDEVLDWWDHGLLGFALDPGFNENGHLYLLYAVDYAYLIANGDPQGTNPVAAPDRMHDTIGRLVRYTCTDPETDPSVDLDSWVILIGHWQTNPTPPHVTDGIPLTSSSHGPDTLLFAPDGTLLVSTGDGAHWQQADVGGLRNTQFSTNTAETDGIVTPTEQVGSFRAQLVNSYNGKILRLDTGAIDPQLGVAGVASNPYYDSLNPFAPRSKVWALGLRNPYRFCIRPGTGQADPAAADPGTLYVGDVGRNDWEEIDVVPGALARSGKANYGWPRFEGMSDTPLYPASSTENLDAPNPLFNGVECTREFFEFNELLIEAVDESLLTPSWPNPCDDEVPIPSELVFMHQRPLLDWNHANAEARVPGYDSDGFARSISIEDSDSPVEGTGFAGICSLGGVFYDGDKFPPAYQGTYFFGDCRLRWIRNIVVDGNDAPQEVRDFCPSTFGQPVSLVVDPDGYGLYYVSISIGQVRRIAVDCNGSGVGDDIDIATGTSRDCNVNGLPDECEEMSSDIDVFVTQLLAAVPDPVLVCMLDGNDDAELDGRDITEFIARIAGL